MERLLGALRPLVCRWALVWTGSPDAAEDVAQAVLMRVHRSVGSYEPTGRFATWVYRITRNVLLDGGRGEDRERTLRDRVALERLAESARGTAGRTEARHLLGRMMDALSPRQRAVLDLVDLQGFDAGEVADMLEISPATVRVHLHRARETLREQARLLDTTEENAHAR
jgi:RNA polymerase sigma-70 factor (ECF subfamily)